MFTGRSSVSLGPHRDRKTGYVRSAFLISPCPIHGKWALCPSIWCNRTAEVRGSIPLGSTNQAKSCLIFPSLKENRRKRSPISETGRASCRERVGNYV